MTRSLFLMRFLVSEDMAILIPRMCLYLPDMSSHKCETLPLSQAESNRYYLERGFTSDGILPLTRDDKEAEICLSLLSRRS